MAGTEPDSISPTSDKAPGRLLDELPDDVYSFGPREYTLIRDRATAFARTTTDPNSQELANTLADMAQQALDGTNEHGIREAVRRARSPFLKALRALGCPT